MTANLRESQEWKRGSLMSNIRRWNIFSNSSTLDFRFGRYLRHHWRFDEGPVKGSLAAPQTSSNASPAPLQKTETISFENRKFSEADFRNCGEDDARSVAEGVGDCRHLIKIIKAISVLQIVDCRCQTICDTIINCSHRICLRLLNHGDASPATRWQENQEAKQDFEIHSPPKCLNLKFWALFPFWHEFLLISRRHDSENGNFILLLCLGLVVTNLLNKWCQVTESPSQDRRRRWLRHLQ